MNVVGLVSAGFTEQIMLLLPILCYNGSLVTWTVVSLTNAKFKPLHLVLYRKYVHSHDFVWLLLAVCTILLHNRVHTEGWKLCANRRLMCTLENSNGVQNLVLHALPLIPRRDKRKSLLGTGFLCPDNPLSMYAFMHEKPSKYARELCT
jgi:hypothetical protein